MQWASIWKRIALRYYRMTKYHRNRLRWMSEQRIVDWREIKRLSRLVRELGGTP